MGRKKEEGTGQKVRRGNGEKSRRRAKTGSGLTIKTPDYSQTVSFPVQELEAEFTRMFEHLRGSADNYPKNHTVITPDPKICAGMAAEKLLRTQYRIKAFILAPSVYEYNHFRRDNYLNEKEYPYLHSPEQCRGTLNADLIVVHHHLLTPRQLDMAIEVRKYLFMKKGANI